MDNKELMAAVSAVQDEVGLVTKDASGHVAKYVSYPQLIASTRESLRKHGLVFTHAVSVLEDGRPALNTLLCHIETGQTLGAVTPIFRAVGKSTNEPQQWGAGISYMRRYQEMAMLDLPHGDDADAAKFAPADDAEKPRAGAGDGAPMPKHAAQDIRNATDNKGLAAVFDMHAATAEHEGWFDEFKRACTARKMEIQRYWDDGEA